MKTFAALLVLGILWFAPRAAHADVLCVPYSYGVYSCEETNHNVPPYNWTASDGGTFTSSVAGAGVEDYVLFRCANQGQPSPNADGSPKVVRVTITVKMPQAPPQPGGLTESTTVDCRTLSAQEGQAWVNEEAVLYMAMIYAQEMAAMGQNVCLAFQVSAMCGFNPYDWNSVSDWYFGQYMLSINWEG